MPAFFKCVRTNFGGIKRKFRSPQGNFFLDENDCKKKKLVTYYFFLLLHGSTTSELLLIAAHDFFNFPERVWVAHDFTKRICLLMEYDMPMRSESCLASVFQPVG